METQTLCTKDCCLDRCGGVSSIGGSNPPKGLLGWRRTSSVYIAAALRPNQISQHHCSTKDCCLEIVVLTRDVMILHLRL